MPSLYETDYHQWAIETAAALREGRLQDIDIEATAEEIEDLAKSERRALRSAVVQLFLHLLKIKYQPERSGSSWENSINTQRDEIATLIEENPSMASLLSDPAFLNRAYRSAVIAAVDQTNKPKETFPATCPFTVADMQVEE
jgi:hypothetical protein